MSYKCILRRNQTTKGQIKNYHFLLTIFSFFCSVEYTEFFKMLHHYLLIYTKESSKIIFDDTDIIERVTSKDFFSF